MKKLKSIAIVTFIYLIGIMCVFAMSVRAEQIDEKKELSTQLTTIENR